MIEFIDAQLLEQMPNLVDFDLECNTIKVIQPCVFEPLKNLKALILSRNRLCTFDRLSFYGLVQLEHLDLSANNIETIHTLDHLKSLANLKWLILNENSQLSTVDCAESEQLQFCIDLTGYLKQFVSLTDVFIDLDFDVNDFICDPANSISIHNNYPDYERFGGDVIKHNTNDIFD